MTTRRGVKASMPALALAGSAALAVITADPATAGSTVRMPTTTHSYCCRSNRNWNTDHNFNPQRHVNNIIINNRFRISNFSQSDNDQNQRQWTDQDQKQKNNQRQRQKIDDEKFGVSSSSSSAAGGGGGGGGGGAGDGDGDGDGGNAKKEDGGSPKQ
ncbi:hypothetical protein [Actinoallomurus sp. NPDC052274]|uniref:hypothetical protein n=1 Tax=Actinoallomurus sp. NPDC052274 TaxID=3155420 RepID=UPI00341A16A2